MTDTPTAVTPPVPEADAPGPSAFPAPADLCAAWRRHVPDVTDDEVMALVPLVQNRRPGWLHLVVAAYRRGFREGYDNGQRDEHEDICDCGQGPGAPR